MYSLGRVVDANSSETGRDGSLEVNRLLISMFVALALSSDVVLGSSNIYHCGVARGMAGFSGSRMRTSPACSGWESRTGSPDWHKKLLQQASQPARRSMGSMDGWHYWRAPILEFIDYGGDGEARSSGQGLAKFISPHGIAVSYDNEIRQHLVFGPGVHKRGWNNGWFDLMTVAGNYEANAGRPETLSVSFRQLADPTDAVDPRPRNKVSERGVIPQVSEISVLPEPDSLGLFLLGAIAVTGCRWWSRRSRRARVRTS